jgi:hypothetical protein
MEREYSAHEAAERGAPIDEFLLDPTPLPQQNPPPETLMPES